MFEDRFTARDKIGSRNNFIDQSDPISLLRRNHFTGKNQLQSPALADQTREALRSTTPREQSQFNFSLPKPAALLANLIVHAIAVSHPPPNAKPLMAATTGLPRFSTKFRTSCPYELELSA